jgi:hypothetical protein
MLTRIRIEVEGEDSAAATEQALTKYEHAIQVAEAQRYRQVRKGRCLGEGSAGEAVDYKEAAQVPDELAQLAPVWSIPVLERGFYADKLGRKVTDEVIEYDPGIPGYKGRRVVQFRRIDTRKSAASAVTPRSWQGGDFSAT